MRVIHLITGLNQGGAEAMLEKLLLTGRRMNPEIEQTVISLGELGVVGLRLQQAGIQVDSMNLRLSPTLFGQLLRLTASLRRHRSDAVVQTWLWHADLVGGLCARAAGNRRVVWNLRNSMPALSDTKFLSRVTARLCAFASGWLPAKIICNSKAALDAHTGVGYDSGRCVIVPNGFDLRIFVHSPEARERVRASWDARSGDLFVGMVARVDPYKDHATFIRAARQVAAALPNIRFVLVGAGVATDRGIEALLRELSLAGRFVLEERREDVQDMMNALDVFCLASKSESFPNVVGEAMACATPAIATDVGDVRELIGDDRLVTPPGNPARLAAAVLHVLSLAVEERLALGFAQRKSIEARFDIENVWRTYRELYSSL